MNNRRETDRKTEEKAKRVAYLEKKRVELTEACTACGKCLKECPVFTRGRFRNKKPREVMLSVLDLLKNGVFSEEAEYAALTCTNCGACISRCPEKLVPLLIFRSAIDKLREIGRSYEPVQDFAHVLGNMLLEASDARWIYNVDKDVVADTVLFPGCDAIRSPHEIRTYMDILDRLGVKAVTLWDEDLCCGFRGYGFNDFEEGDRLAGKLISTLEAMKAKTVFLSCGQCFHQFTRSLPKRFSMKFNTVYLPSYLFETLKSSELPMAIPKRVAVHDSCKSARGIRDFDSVRGLLTMIPGGELVEMRQNRENALCCGGIKNFSHPELTSGLIRERLKQAKDAGADVLATDCTLCYSVYSVLMEEFSIDVRHFSSSIAESMGLEQRADEYQRLLSLGWEGFEGKLGKGAGIGNMNEDTLNRQIHALWEVVSKLREKGG